MEPAENVDDGDAGFTRRPIGIAGDAHQPTFRLRDEVIPRPAGRSALGPEPRDRAV